MDTTRIIFDTPLPPLLVAALASVLVIAALVYAVRDTRTLSRRARRGILTMMVIAGIMLVALALGPRIIRQYTDPHPTQLALLIDGSRSMLQEDTYEGEPAAWIRSHMPESETDEAVAATDAPAGPAAATAKPVRISRQELVRMILADGHDGWLGTLGEQFEIQPYRFAGGIERISISNSGGSEGFSVDDEGFTTAAGEILEQLGAGTGGRRPRAIIMIGDGAWNKGRDPADVARVLGRTELPVHVLGLGDPNPPKDAAVLSLRCDETALLGDEVALTALVSSTGLASMNLPVELLIGGAVVDRKEVMTLATGQPVSVQFRHIPREPGRLLYSVRVPKLADEENAENNSASAAVEVTEQKIRVLLIDSEPRWEFRFLRTVFERDPSIKLTVSLLRPGIGPLSGPGYCHKLPTEKNEFADYDLIFLGDVPVSAMPEAFLAETAEMVRQRGGALVVIAGKRGHYRGLAGTALAPVLPVRLDAAAVLGNEAGDYFQPELTQEGQSHLLTRLASQEDQNQAVWKVLPPSQWSAMIGELIPGATALLVHPHRLSGTSKMPLMAVQRAGAGKVMFMAIEDTWRWRRGEGDLYHYRFWAQVVRWMVKKQFGGSDAKARLSVDRLRCDTGENIQIEAYCLGPDGYPLREARVWAEVIDGEGKGQRVAMEPADGNWGIWQAKYTATKAGKFRIRPIVSVYGDKPLESEVEVTVERVNLENNFRAQNRQSLEAIAAASGGQYLSFAEAGKLSELLAGKAEKRVITEEYSPCQHWAYYSIIAALLGGAWLTRKRSGLA